MRGFSIIAAILAGFMVTPASATTLVADSGWQNDQTNAAGIPSANSSWDFTLAGNGLFSVTDCCAPGDIFTLSGGATGLTTYYAGLGTDVQASGAYGSYWTDASFSKIAVALGAGTYSISIAGDCGAGCPAGLGVRLDSVAAVPEPATWATLLLGLGVVGFAMRNRTRQNVRVTYA